MDINKAIDSVIETDDEGVIVPLVDREGEPYLQADGKPVTMTVLGEESAPVKRVDARHTRHAIRGGGQKVADEADKRLVERAASAIVAWNGVDDETGAPMPFTPENVKHILRAPWILMTVIHAMRERSDFFVSNSTD